MKELEQTAVVAAAAGLPAGGNHSSAGPARPRLHPSLSVEHASIAMKLTAREMSIVLELGTGAEVAAIARRLGLAFTTVESYLRVLRAKTQMSSLGLAVMGYMLAGQADRISP